MEINDEIGGCYKTKKNSSHDEEIDNLHFLSTLYQEHEENTLYSIIQQFLIKHFSPEFIINNRIIDLLTTILIIVNNDTDNSNQLIRESLTQLIDKIKKIIKS